MDGNEIYVYNLIAKLSAKWVPNEQTIDIYTDEEDSTLSQAKKIAYDVLKDVQLLQDK